MAAVQAARLLFSRGALGSQISNSLRTRSVPAIRSYCAKAGQKKSGPNYGLLAALAAIGGGGGYYYWTTQGKNITTC